MYDQPNFAEYDECELCGELAVPYDTCSDYGFCPEHALQMYTGTGLADLIIDAERQRAIEIVLITRGRVLDTGSCSIWRCRNWAAPRMKHLLDSPDVMMTVSNLCSEHAMELATGQSELLTMLQWADSFD